MEGRLEMFSSQSNRKTKTTPFYVLVNFSTCTAFSLWHEQKCTKHIADQTTITSRLL